MDKKAGVDDGVRETIYYIDRIKINVKKKKDNLFKILPMRELSQYCRDIDIYDCNSANKKFGWLSTIDAVAVKYLDFFRVLGEYAEFLTGYKISYVEIAEDSLYATKEETTEVFDKILEHTVKRYSPDFFIYDATVADFGNETVDKMANPNKSSDKYQKEKYSDRTGYWGTKKFKYVIYPRISKIAGKPSIHSEWRITSAGNIKKKTGIKSINDFTYFDFEVFFRKQGKIYLQQVQIDHLRHGKFLQGINHKTNSVQHFGAGNFPYDRAKRASHMLCRIHEITSAAELRYFYKTEIAKLKKKGSGRRTRWEEKVLEVTYAKLTQFFVLL